MGQEHGVSVCGVGGQESEAGVRGKYVNSLLKAWCSFKSNGWTQAETLTEEQ